MIITILRVNDFCLLVLSRITFYLFNFLISSFAKCDLVWFSFSVKISLKIILPVSFQEICNFWVRKKLMQFFLDHFYNCFFFCFVFCLSINPWSPNTVNINLTHCTDCIFKIFLKMHKKMVTLKITSNFSPVFCYNSIHYFLVCVSCPPSGGNDVGYNSIHNKKFFGFFKKISKENMIS